MKIEPLANSTFGAIVTDVDLSSNEIKPALYEFGLLIFSKAQLPSGGLLNVAKRFGSIEGGDQVHILSNRNAAGKTISRQHPVWLTLNEATRNWHMDGSYKPIPIKVTIYVCVNIPASGGQTEFADMCAAYDALDAQTKEELVDLKAYHSLLIGITRELPRENQEDFARFVGETPDRGYYGLGLSANVPLRSLVRVHPMTGREILYLGYYAFGVPGMTPMESELFLADLADNACQLPRIYKHQWQVGDLLIFDALRMLHRAREYDEEGDYRKLMTCRVVSEEADVGIQTSDSIDVQASELFRLRELVA